MADLKFTYKILHGNPGLAPSTLGFSLTISSIKRQSILLNQHRAVSAAETSLFVAVYRPSGTFCLRESS